MLNGGLLRIAVPALRVVALSNVTSNDRRMLVISLYNKSHTLWSNMTSHMTVIRYSDHMRPSYARRHIWRSQTSHKGVT